MCFSLYMLWLCLVNLFHLLHQVLSLKTCFLLKEVSAHFVTLMFKPVSQFQPILRGTLKIVRSCKFHPTKGKKKEGKKQQTKLCAFPDWPPRVSSAAAHASLHVCI